MTLCPFPAAPEISTEHVPCGMCGSDAGSLYAQSYDYEYQTCRNLWSFLRCTQCGNIYLCPRPARSALPIIYPKTYYAYNYRESVNPIAYHVKNWLDKHRLNAILKELSIPLHCYMDIGCGDGRYLKLVADIGVSRTSIYGIELDEQLASRLADDDFQMRSKPFEDVHDIPKGEFQLITLFSVLEHMPSPRQALQHAFELLCRRGLLVFEVPNNRSLNAKLFRSHYWGGYHTPRHWNLFSADTVKNIANDLGYELKKIRRTTGHSFWLWSIHHYLRYHLGFNRLGKMFTPRKCLPGLAIVTPIDLLRARFNCETDNMLVFLEKK